MKVTINTPHRVVRFNGKAHYLSQAGMNQVFAWLMDHSTLLWGWAGLEYVFYVEVTP